MNKTFDANITIRKVDWSMLRTQKSTLIKVIDLGTKESTALQGILNLIDHIQDEAAKDLGDDVVFCDSPSTKVETPKIESKATDVAEGTLVGSIDKLSLENQKLLFYGDKEIPEDSGTETIKVLVGVEMEMPVGTDTAIVESHIVSQLNAIEEPAETTSVNIINIESE